ncbi:MAG: type II toxin-antitoxin system HicA family toxin [Bacteroidales bacterium]|nr:type II toxin-antitoxin system HicA family toxin [Bacteroidales bacterium]MCF8334249.1 type II toxin-antitoxin system HicA family toxin [Bacteroidales bacterium]
MKIPRDISGYELANALEIYGYKITRQKGSHMLLTTQKKGEHHITIPNHKPLKIGTLSAILSEVSKHMEINKEELMNKLFS